MPDRSQDFRTMFAEILEELDSRGETSDLASLAQRAEQSSSELNPTQAEDLVEALDRVVSSDTANLETKNKCSAILRQVSSTHNILPKSYHLPNVIRDDEVVNPGSYPNVLRGKLDGKRVCIKAFRPTENLDKIKQVFYHEITVWKSIRHPNVVQFLGVSETVFSLCIITPWMRNGNIVAYIRKKQQANRFLLLAQAACGLEYLHSLDIIHSAVYPESILIRDDGDACLGDLGITSLITDPRLVEPGSPIATKFGFSRYRAPELRNREKVGPDQSVFTKETDIFSFGATIFEVLITPVLPDREVLTPSSANKEWLRPEMLDIIRRCWKDYPEERMVIKDACDWLSEEALKVEPSDPPETLSASTSTLSDPIQAPFLDKAHKTSAGPRGLRKACHIVRRFHLPGNLFGRK